MAENQTQPNMGRMPNPQAGGAAGDDAKGPVGAGPSDTEAAHAPQEGRTFGVSPPHTDENFGSGVGGGRDPREDYGDASGHSQPGTDKHTAGAAFADRMPEASSTPAVEGDLPGAKKSPTS